MNNFKTQRDSKNQYQVLPALCLDLDGTIRHPKKGRFINKPEDIALYEGVEEKIWEYRSKGYLIFGITNQGGVAYGMKTPQSNQKELEHMVSLFEENPFHTIKSSYFHASGRVSPYNNRSLLRKPDIGMLVLCEVEALEAGYVVDWDKSQFVGDRPEDQQCAINAGIEFHWAKDFFERNE